MIEQRFAQYELLSEITSHYFLNNADLGVMGEPCTTLGSGPADLLPGLLSLTPGLPGPGHSVSGPGARNLRSELATDSVLPAPG